VTCFKSSTAQSLKAPPEAVKCMAFKPLGISPVEKSAFS